MKKFTDQNEIKYIYDKKFTDNDELKEKVITYCCNDVIATEAAFEHMSKNKIPVKDLEAKFRMEKMKQNLNNFVCDHVYYDNPYNISKIYLDKNGCPQVFEFENKKDRDEALESYYANFKNYNQLITIGNIFNIAYLISDDYPDFKNYFVVWDPEDFIKANAENAIPKTINFGEFENFRNYKKECSK